MSKEPKIKAILNKQFNEIGKSSVSIAKITNEYDTVLRYSLSIGGMGTDKSYSHVRFDMSESEFVEFVDNLFNEIYDNKCVYCEEESAEKMSVCNSCWEYKMKFGEQ